VQNATEEGWRKLAIKKAVYPSWVTSVTFLKQFGLIFFTVSSSFRPFFLSLLREAKEK
jgi:hypothetical protein